MGGKPRKPPHREVWLSRDDFGPVEIWNERPVKGVYPNMPTAWFAPTGGSLSVDPDMLDIEVPTDHPIRVRLRVEVVSE